MTAIDDYLQQVGSLNREAPPCAWPKVVGKLEYVGGRLIYMTPSGDIQQDVTGSVAGLLDRWLDEHPEYTFGTNEAGMMLGGEVRAADAAVWARKDLGPYSGGYRRVPPILAVEVAGVAVAMSGCRGGAPVLALLVSACGDRSVGRPPGDGGMDPAISDSCRRIARVLKMRASMRRVTRAALARCKILLDGATPPR